MFQANDQPATNGERHLDEGSYSRYFLVPKAGRQERSAGLDGEEQPILWSSGTKNPGSFQAEGTKRSARNHHPTIKPLELMSHLVRLVTPPGGIVLDPFIGSGSTAVAAIASGRRCVGIELDATYLALIVPRLRLLRS
jgi:site-specific DNA-methyltransferase (adenine-specific)